ncbi:S1 RNA-binding domain-containing protein [Nonomuraea sp. NPDC050556]|uniref:S1 RNA-binding domain-containing protein n=1 Tax=Nonomuraea sp. NPDC050556 TaxID=3364369 RepID=UPI0037B5A0AB
MAELTEHEMVFLQNLQRGQTITGTVTEIATFGVTFVDIGGYTAMINIPELSWRPIGHPSDVVAVGQTITTEILDVDLGRGRVSLSLKSLQPDPLINFKAQTGRIVAGPVTKVVPIGAFVRIEDRPDGFEGLVPSTELANLRVDIGDALTVEIVDVDVIRRRIELALAESLATVTALWADHVHEPFPDDLRWINVPSGESVPALDSYIAGCIITYIARQGTLDPQRQQILTGCAEDLAALVPSLEGTAAAYVGRLIKMADLARAETRQ